MKHVIARLVGFVLLGLVVYFTPDPKPRRRRKP